MSHFAQRKQNNCLNCNAAVYGRYCHVCGQENVEPKKSAWHLVTHFVYDITHFDGKFFKTVKYLLLKPGFLPSEYMLGRRMRYLNPIKMYVFVSAFFFLFFFSIVNPAHKVNKRETEKPEYKEVKAKIESSIRDLQKNVKDPDNPAFARKIMQNQLTLLQQDMQTLAKDTAHLAELNYFKVKELSVFLGQYKDVAQYDSVQNSLPEKDKNSWLEKITSRKIIEIQSKYKYDGNEFLKTLLEKFLHSFPQLLFVSLPLIALLLKLLYARRKNFYYADHIIYAVHLYCAMFILLFIYLSVSHIKHYNYLHWTKYLAVPVIIYAIWYQYKSLRNFYEQSRVKTLLKDFLLLLLSSFVMALLFIVFLVLSVFKL